MASPAMTREKAEARVREARIEAAHAAAEAAGEAGYADPETGLFVFTATTLAAKGTCCSSGCRHCPYGTVPMRPVCAGTDTQTSSDGC
jgi:hypothetical protein